VPPLSATARARLPDSSFAYIDSKGQRRLPINDASHVRNALARFDQVDFEDDAARERARQRLLRAARRHGIVPIGFFDGQIRNERLQSEFKARATDIASLPRGTVTFLLTDIEGSTRLLQRLGDGYAQLLREVRTIIRTSVRGADGHEIDARADEFFAVFGRPARALDAALLIQRTLAKRKWPRALVVRVRIGIHTGRPTLTDTGYVGIPVHTILLSSVTRKSLREVGGVTFRNLGRHKLPGLPLAQGLFLVCADDLLAEFPGLRVTVT